MGNKNSGVRLHQVNQDFFKKWTPNMAYILGFTCADGNVHRLSLTWDLSNKHSSNFDLLNGFNKSLKSSYPILHKKHSFRLRISSSTLLKDLNNLGIIPNKKKILLFPKVPDKYLSHFIRGFLDGDGWITIRMRKKGYQEISVGFSNGSIEFMQILIEKLRRLDIKNFNLRCREKRTIKGNISKTYQLEFYSENCFRVLSFLYANLKKRDLTLKRKYQKYLKVIEVFDYINKNKKFGRNWVEIEKKYSKSMSLLLREFLNRDKKIPKNIAEELGVSLSTLYRWLDKSGVRAFERRMSLY